MHMMFQRVLLNIKHSSNATLKAWGYQCESILAQRSRRLQQLFTFYHRVYGSQGLELLIRSYRGQLPHFKGKNLVLSAVGVFGCVTGNCSGSGFDWNTERLSLANFDVCVRDLEFVNTIHRNKLCEQCKERNMKYCYCSIGNKESRPPRALEKGGTVNDAHYRGKAMIEYTKSGKWEPYFCTNEFDIWKREERSDRYSYKVYARYNDISASDLLHVQIDLDYRKQWDNSAVALHLIEEDPLPGTNSHLIYWELQWPKFFSNRDYVYCRRFIFDEDRKAMMVINRGTKHPLYPETSGKVRVTDYWSFVVIKPFRSFQEPGVHYILTYFDDPGLPIPQSIKSWVVQKQMPETLQKMYYATKNYSYRKALAMKEVFSSFSKYNNDYEGNKLRDTWVKRFWKQDSSDDEHKRK